MDFISHGLLGRALAVSPKYQKREIWLITFFAVLPDIPQIVLYFYVGFLNNRFFWIPQLADWSGFRQLHPVWSALWEVPHSLLFLVLIATIVFLFKLPKMAFVAYLAHLVLDLFSHTGEWAVKPLYPLDFTMEGFVDVWAWPVWVWVILWLVLIMMIWRLNKFFKAK